ncbi:carph-isopro domain-containing protein [Phyllobacterium phragmitis]|nr:helix-turn-helix domain-containing protein [Phyllobacterium phragmitis]
MNTIKDLFEDLGGTGAVARIISVKHSAASEMRRRGSIPVKYWPAIIAEASARELSVDSDTLVAMHVSNAETAA